MNSPVRVPSKALKYFFRTGLSSTPSENRLTSLDAIKALACVCVIIMHSLRNLNSNVPYHSALYYFTRISIPLFFMVSGYLQILRKKCTFSYCLHKIFKIIFIVTAWVLLYNVASFLLFKRPLQLKDVVICYLQKGPYSVFCFFGSMCILYLLLPLLNKFFISRRFAVCFTGILAFLCFIIHIASILYASKHGVFLQAFVIQTFRLWTWLFYFCLGGCIKNFKLNEKFHSIKILLFLFIACGVLALFNQFYLFKVMTNVVNGEYYYDSPVLMLMVTSLFLLLMNIKYNATLTQIINFIAPALIGIYVFHIQIIKTLAPHLQFSGFFGEYRAIAVIIALTLIISRIVIKTPYLNRLTKL